MNLDIIWTSQFKKEYKLSIKRGLKIELLDNIIEQLAKGYPLPQKNRDHALAGNFSAFRECHIQPNWLLIYRIENHALALVLVRTGTHSDLLEK